MYRTVFIIIIVTLCTNHLCFAEDITLEELIRGTNKARMTIKSGEIHTELTEENAAEKTEEEIDAYIQEEIEKELKSYVPHDGVDKETLKNDYLIPNFKYNANRFRKHTVVEHTTTLFQIEDPNSDAFPKLYHYKLTMIKSPGFTLDSETAQNHHANETYMLTYDTQIQVKLDIGDILFARHPLSPHSVNIYNGNEYYGYGHNSMLGRSFFRVPADAKHLGKETIDNKECHVLAFPVNEYKLNIRIWVDPSIDYCVRRLEFLRNLETEDVSFRMENKDYQKFNDVWYPTNIEETYYKKDGTISRRNMIKIKSALFNVDFPLDFFKIDRHYFGK